MIFIAVLKLPLLIVCILHIHCGNVGSSLEFINMEVSTSEWVIPSLFHRVVLESLVIHMCLFVYDQVLVETFEKNGFWMRKRLNWLISWIICELLVWVWVFHTFEVSWENIVNSPYFWVIFFLFGNLESDLRSFIIRSRWNDIEALTINHFFVVHSWLKRWWVNTAFNNLKFVFHILVWWNPITVFSWTSQFSWLTHALSLIHRSWA